MRNKKGSVAIEDRQGHIRLRWRVGGQRYVLSLGLPHNKTNLPVARKVAAQIEVDILSGHFDPTLARYRPHNPAPALPDDSLLAVWDKWVTSLQLAPRTLNGHYSRARRHISTQAPKLTDATWLTRLTLVPKSLNSLTGFLVRCLDWAVEQGMADHNPYRDIKPRKVIKTPIRPFTKQEMEDIIGAFRDNRFSSRKSNTPHSHYGDYVEFLFLTGARPAEAIGLQRKHIDFLKNELVIESSLARGDKGETSSNRRVRKETKTGSVRYLTLTPRLRVMLESRCSELGPDDLVFPSPRGLAIDDAGFRKRQWARVLEGLGIPYRHPYICRHTFCSMALEKGMKVTEVAYLMGHQDTNQVIKTYGHLIGRPSLPDL